MTDSGTIEDLLGEYRDAVYAKDVDSFVALYDREIRVFDMWARWSYVGVDDVRRMTMGWFGSLGSDRVAVEWDDVRMDVGADLAGVQAFITFRGVSADGAQLRSMRNRLTWFVRRVDGRWRIAHEHTSAPLDPETAKAIFAPVGAT